MVHDLNLTSKHCSKPECDTLEKQSEEPKTKTHEPHQADDQKLALTHTEKCDSVAINDGLTGIRASQARSNAGELVRFLLIADSNVDVDDRVDDRIDVVLFSGACSL